MSADRQIDADDWSDTDLLTKDEAGERLDDEIAVVTARLAELSAVADSVAEAELLTKRLAAMEVARAALRR
ncbi:hypothetical protein OG874_11745 [Nocardia sp. NBC_00565]|uniref:hypothetical protein n=1 Tax=Nocardia sp. NBC_00565 TaxID=2975993 RepID=UPI002E7FBB0E|nr:hypothetical protein [Nocardia sp. NBC_00565]WUC05764.1 hypothetical protein OG874_11745 [Nocardia sp. NBC_00565]